MILALALIFSLPAPLQSLQSTFKSVKSFEVNFTQDVQQDLFPESAEKATGRLMYSRPKSMTWTYEKPKFRKIQFTGAELIIEENGEKEIIHEQGRLTLEKAFAFLWGEPDASLFKVQSKSKTAFLVQPRDPETVTFESIEVTVSEGRVKTVNVKDRLGGGSRIEFKDWVLRR